MESVRLTTEEEEESERSSMPLSEVSFNRQAFGENMKPEVEVVDSIWAMVFGACFRACGLKRGYR
jgi:hypothetical protein